MAAVPLDRTCPEVCPNCMGLFPNHTAMWRHKQRCKDNPDPICRWCDLKFEQRKLPSHEYKCHRNPATLKRPNLARPPEIPWDRLTETDLLVLPLAAHPLDKPPPISEMRKSQPTSEEALVDADNI